MAEYEVKLTGEHLASLMSNDEGFRKLLQDRIISFKNKRRTATTLHQNTPLFFMYLFIKYTKFLPQSFENIVWPCPSLASNSISIS